MKKFLQRSCAWLVALVAWFAVSMSAMAQGPDATFDCRSAVHETVGKVTYSQSCGYDPYYGINLYGGTQFTITATDNIEKVVLRSLIPYAYIYVGFSGASGSFTGTYSAASGETLASVTWVPTGDCTSVSFTNGTDGADFYVGYVDVYLKGGGTTDPAVVPDGTAVTTLVDGMEYTLAVVSYWYNYKRFWNVNAAGNNTELSSGSEGTRYTCEVHGDKVALRAPNGKYLRVKQPNDVTWMSDYSLTGLDDNYSEFCNLTIEPYSGYQNGIAIKGARGYQYGAPSLGYFCASYSNYGYSNWGFSANSSAGWSNNFSTVFEARQYTPEVVEDTDYTIEFVNAPEGASVTIDGIQYFANATFTVAKNLNEASVANVVEPEGYYSEVSYDADSHTFTIAYHKYIEYGIVVEGTDNPNAGVVYDNVAYNAGRPLYTRTAITVDNVEAVEIDGYEGVVTLSDNTFTVSYEVAEYITINTSNNAWSNETQYSIEDEDGLLSVSGTAYGKRFNVWNNYTLSVSSSAGSIKKIKFTSTTDMPNLYEVDNKGSYKASKKTWTASGDTNEVTFKTTDGDYYITSVQVLLAMDPIDYKVVFVDVPEGANVAATIEGTEYSADAEFAVNKKLTASSVTNVVEPENYYAEVSYDEDTHTFTVTYKRYVEYLVIVVGDYTGEGAGLLCDGTVYGNGFIQSKGEITEPVAAGVKGYNAEAYVDGNTIVIIYSVKPVPTAPWTFEFTENTLADCVIVDRNADGNTWSYVTEDGVDGVANSSSVTGNSDDYLILPPVRLKAGKNYEVSFNCSSPWITAEKMEVVYGLQQEVDALTGVVIPEREFTWMSPQDVNGLLSVDTTGDYYFAIHATSYKKAYIKAISFSVIETPDFIEGLTLSPADGEEIVALNDITVTAPAGVTFPEDLTIPATVQVDGYDYPVSLKSVEASKVTFTINQPTRDGSHTVVLPAHFLEAEDGSVSPEITVTYNVFNPLYSFAYTSRYATGNLKRLSAIELQPDNDYDSFDEGTYPINILIDGQKVEAQAECIGNKATISFPELNVAGSYIITIPARAITCAEGRKTNILARVEVNLVPCIAVQEGTQWTTFALDKPFSLPADYTAYIVTGLDDTKLQLQEIEGGEPVRDYVDLGASNVQSRWGYDYYDTLITAGDDKPYITTDVFVQKSYGFYIYAYASEVNLTFHAPEGGIITRIEPTYDDSDLEWQDGRVNGYATPNAATYTARMFRTDDYWDQYILGFHIEYEIPGAAVIPAYTGVLINGPVGRDIEYTVKSDDAECADVSGNLLRGCTWAVSVKDDPDYLYYKFSLNANNEAGSEGFYYGYADGHSIDMKANKAYLVLDAAAASNSRYLINGFDDDTLTGIDTVIAPEQAESIYNLQGQRVGKANAGIYVKNGKKIIVK